MGVKVIKTSKKEKDKLTLKDKGWRDFSGRVLPEHEKSHEDMAWCDTIKNFGD